MNFSPENNFKTLSLHDSKAHINIAITATHISAGSWLKKFQLQFCLSLFPCVTNWGLKAVSSHKDPILQLPESSAVLMQGASFIYRWLTSRKKIPRRKLALKNSCTVSLSRRRYCLGNFFVCLGLVWGFSHPSHKVWCWQSAQQWGAAPPLSSGLQPSRLLLRHQEKEQLHYKPSCLSATLLYSASPCLYNFRHDSFSQHRTSCFLCTRDIDQSLELVWVLPTEFRITGITMLIKASSIQPHPTVT